MNAMKMMMISIRPQWVVKILNGEKTIEIRKRFPSDYVGWVYVYCTKEKSAWYFNSEKTFVDIGEQSPTINGKVVARFWCDKVEEIDKDNLDGEYWKEIEYWKDEACLTYEELRSYLKGKNGKAIPITKLEIFDKPKDISEFKPHCNYPTNRRLNKAPQSWCYIEI